MTIKAILTKLTLALSATLIASGSLPANAGPKSDYFSRNTSSVPVAAPRPVQPQPYHADKSVATIWFEGFDNAIATHRATPTETTLLTRPLNQEKERVIAWSQTASRVAHRYRELSRILKSMPIPPGLSGRSKNGTSLQEFRDLKADWYADSAQLLEDWIRPRKPAATVEELDSTLDNMRTRSLAQKDFNANLSKMDSDLRGEFNVHMARHEDKIWGFASQAPASQRQR